MQCHNSYDGKKVLEASGIKFLETINEAYQYAALPNGWRLQNFATILDEKNRQRAHRKQYFNVPVLKILTRYEVHAVDEKGEVVVVNGDNLTVSEYISIFTVNVYGAIMTVNAFDTDTKSIIYSTEVNYIGQPESWQGWKQSRSIEVERKKYLKAINDAEEKVKQWLDNNFREWRNPCAYW